MPRSPSQSLLPKSRGFGWNASTLLLGCGVTLVAALGGLALFGGGRDATGQTPSGRSAAARLDTIPFDGAASYAMLERICAIGPRISGSEGMTRQQKLLRDHFTELGANVRDQSFTARDPRHGRPVAMTNLYVEWHPDRKRRILLCAHYDTRPFPDRDPVRSRRKAPFIGANDGGSGVALLAELGRHMKELDGPIGVDFVLFDGEEYVFDSKDEYFLGSTYFARKYVENPPEHRYLYGVLVDMIGDKDLQILQEQHSLSWRETKALTQSIWATANKLGVREFIAHPGHEVLDDHMPLNKIARIPTCDVIDFDYPNPRASASYWHTTHDTVDKCSALSLAKVGWVLHQWLLEVQVHAQKE